MATHLPSGDKATEYTSSEWPRLSICAQIARQPCYMGTSLTRKRTPLGPYRRPMPRVLGGS